MLTAAEIALWSTEDALYELKERLPLGWRLTLREEEGYSVAELYDETGSRVWLNSSPDAKALYIDGSLWLMTRDHKPQHPAWKPREHEAILRAPNLHSRDLDRPDLDPAEVEAVYKNRR
jgi:hypothetical protein